MIRIEASKAGAKLFRNQNGAYKTADGRFIRSGMGNGTADLIGWQSVTVTPDMVGKKIAVFCAVEVKKPKGRRTEEQIRFINVVKNDGGRAGFAESVKQAMGIVNNDE